MRILIDTHIFLWLINDNPRLSNRKRQIIYDLDNEIFLSVVWNLIKLKRDTGSIGSKRNRVS